MNRQRILLIVVAVLGVAFLGRSVVGLYQGALKEREDEARTIRNKIAQAKAQRQLADDNAKDWQKLGSQTLSMDPNEVMRVLRDDLFDITKKNGLTKEKVDLGTVQPWGKNGLRVLNCSVSGEGSLDQMVRFLFSLYRRPYVARIKSLTLAQAGGGKNAVKGHLKITSKIETLILPPNTRVPTITPAVIKKDADQSVERTKFAKLDDYKVIIDRKIVEPYVPPMPGKATTPTPAQDAQNIEGSNVTLTWTAGPNTLKHMVFFGEGAPSQSLGTLTATQVARTGLKPGIRYYWRVDEVGEAGTTTGDVWIFSTKGAPAPPPVVTTSGPPPKPVEVPGPECPMVLVRVLSSPLVQEAILVDAAQQQVPLAVEKRVVVGDPFCNGILIYVSNRPEGAVSDKDGVLRWHPRGVPVNQAQVLSPQEQPQVWHELKKLEAQATGISERPG